ncbi:MAG: domain containing rane protein [Deltaproteobacteria bacterium]|nr:domain containing rane protein [Deltaproteobacteria bacterium]
MPLASIPVSRIMRTEFASLRETDHLDLADQIMKLGRVRHLPVLDPDGRIIGIVSNRDLLEASLTNVLDFEREQRQGFLRSVDVAEVMTREVETIAPDAPLAAAASRLVAHRIGCLPIVRDDRVMVGLVTETDLLAAAFLGTAE